MLKNLSIVLFFAVVSIFAACSSPESKKKRPSFETVEGIKFIEVRREFDTGYSFSKEGFQQVPEWTLIFLPTDSVKIWSPLEKRYIHYPIYFDHDQVVNFAREWLRIVHLSKDSLVLQLLKVESKEVKRDLSKVYMRFYSENYINNVLHKDYRQMRKPSARDTLYIKRLIERANKYPNISDSLFSSREPVGFVSLSNNISVEKREQDKSDLDYSAANAYLNPSYDISIRKAYKDFACQYTAYVDKDGNITVGSFANLEKEFEAPKRRVLQGISDVYLERGLKIKPGSTLGIPHATEVVLYVAGSKE